MNADIGAHDHQHLSGDSATHPIEPRCGALAALLLFAEGYPAASSRLPARRITAHSGAFNCRF